MVENNGYVEYYRKYRPKILDDVVGQDGAVKTLKGLLKKKEIPHAILIHGPSGCGKTTLAGILKDELKCDDMDFHVVDCPSLKDVTDTVRDITNSLSLSSWAGKDRPVIWFLEEIQSFSRSSYAQQALLLALENPPPHVYFFLATTDPNKLVPAIRTRCTKIGVSALSSKDLKNMVQRVVEKEGLEDSEEVVDKIIEHSHGSGRESLVLLQQVSGHTGEEEQLDLISSIDTEKRAIDLARALFKREPWSKIAKLIKDNEDKPESIRNVVLSYASSVLLNKNDPRAYMIITAFETDFFQSGRAGLTRACYEVCSRKD